MQVARRVIFDPEERLVFEQMSLALYVGFPKPEGTGKAHKHRNRDAEAHAVLGRLEKRGELWGHRQLAQAEIFLAHLVSVLKVEADPAHWQAMVPSLEASAASLQGKGQVGLIANPQVMIDVIVEARRGFLDSALAALNLVNQAVPHAHDVVDREDS